jgi:type II secretory pathway pseudopilin PulG
MSLFHQHIPLRCRRKKCTGGFSLLELIVATTILLTLSLTFLFNYGNFDRRVTVDILAHQIASWVHDAQVTAMSVKRTRNVAGQYPGYGIHFDLATPNKFIYFADTNKDRVYTPPGAGVLCGDATSECEQQVTLLQGNIVSLLCGNMPQGAQSATCLSATPGNPMLYTTNTLDIVFTRPNPFDANILGNSVTSYSQVEITVASPKGYKHTIIVWATGQVTVR